MSEANDLLETNGRLRQEGTCKNRNYDAFTLSWHFIINSSVEFAICKVWLFLPVQHKKNAVTQNLQVDPGALDVPECTKCER